MSNPDGTFPEHPTDVVFNLARQHQERADELEAIVRDLADPDLTRGGDHDGPCINYDDQDPDDYTEHDSCSRHIAASSARRERLQHLVDRATAWVAAQ